MYRSNRRKDRPHHVAKAVREKAGAFFQDVVSGLKPSDESFFAFGRIVYLPETKEGMHLVEIATDLLVLNLEVSNRGIAVHFQQMRLSAEHAPDGVVGLRIFIGISMTHDGPGQLRKIAGQADRWSISIGQRIEKTRSVPDIPHNVFRSYVRAINPRT